MTTSQDIMLEIVGPYGPDGIQTEDAVEHFNDVVMSPYGEVGSLKAHVEDGEVVIDQADEVVLISSKPIEQWSEDKRLGAAIVDSPFGYKLFRLKARNGSVTYSLQEGEVRWVDMPEKSTGLTIGTVFTSNWTPEGPPPPRYRNEVTTKVMRKPS